MLTGNAYFNMPWAVYKGAILDPTLAKYGLQPRVSTEGLLLAEVNHGRWIVKCECGGAEKMWEEGVFMCQSCYNATHKHQYRKAIFPQSRKAIEAILSKRPLPNRNWQSGETLEQLKRENEEHREELL